MSLKTSQPWVPLEKIENLVQLEPALFTIGLAAAAWIVSRFFLPHLPPERRRSLKRHFRNLSRYLLLGLSFFFAFLGLQQLPYENTFIERLMTYIGLTAVFCGSIVFVKVSKILVLEYLYLRHMKVAFPVLLVNLFTLLLSIGLGAWICADIFNIRLAPILATSAIFSLVLGLALQDTLGNLFSGVALQFDKPYAIGDWIEIQTGTQKWVGKVLEISWRATILMGFANETITVPNRTMGQAQIANFSSKFHSILRTQIFKLPAEYEVEAPRRILTEALNQVSSIRQDPPPRVWISETTESGVVFKLIYSIDDYGAQFQIADEIQSQILPRLQDSGYELAGHVIRLAQAKESRPLPLEQ